MKKNLIKKILIGGIVTCLCLCLTFVVNATQLEDYSPTNGTQTLPLKTWDDIDEPNDLQGVTLLFNDIIKPIGLPYNYRSSYLEIRYTYNSEEYELESKPIIWGTDQNGIQIKYENETPIILTIAEEYGGDDPLTIFGGTQNSSNILFKLYDPDYEYNLTNITWSGTWTYGPRLISFPLDQRDPESVKLEITTFGSNFDYETFGTSWNAVYAFLKRNTTIVYSSSMANDLLSLNEINAYNEGYNVGYNVGYNNGYEDGTLNSGDDSYRFTFLTGIFNGVSDLLAIEIFPNIQLGYFVFVPLALGITGMIFWFWRKD